MPLSPDQIHAKRKLDSENLERLVNERLDRAWPVHVSPFSCLIAAIGNHWEPGCLEAVDAMAEYTFQQGYQVEFYEEHDRCHQPYDALGTMRNLAYMRALNEGHEFICYVDNDVKPEPDALVRLMHRFLPVVVPIIEYPTRRIPYATGEDKANLLQELEEEGEEVVLREETHNGMPHLVAMKHYGLTACRTERNQGLAMIGSSVLSFLVFQTRALFPWSDGTFWSDTIGADESYHFRKLELAGHRPFIDTEVVVPCVKGPTFPLDNKP